MEIKPWYILTRARMSKGGILLKMNRKKILAIVKTTRLARMRKSHTEFQQGKLMERM